MSRKIDCKCAVCGKEWVRFVSQKRHTYCSVACYNKARGLGSRYCESCGKEFKPTQRKKSGKFCSLPCYWKSMELPAETKRQNRLENVRKYRKEHPEWTQAVKQRRRAREVGAEGHFTAEDWKSIKISQNNKCANCGEERKLTVDHIVPLSKGGSNFPTNIQGLCGICNSRKWAKI